MKTQSTPGPWHAEQNGELPDRPWTVGKLFYNVADVGNEADARLIASAPELLEALEVIKAVSHEFGVMPEAAMKMYELARAAIAKAKGEA